VAAVVLEAAGHSSPRPQDSPQVRRLRKEQDAWHISALHTGSVAQLADNAKPTCEATIAGTEVGASKSPP